MHLTRTLFLITSILITLPAIAQQREEKTRNNEIGLFADLNISSSSQHTEMYGVQFRHFKNDIYRNNTLGYRILIGTGSFKNEGGDNKRLYPGGNSDTVITSSLDRWQEINFIGVGVDAQRNFYKKIWLYAAVSITGGFGEARVDSNVRTYIRSTDRYVDLHSERTRYSYGNAFWIRVSPIIGAKVALAKILWVGLEWSNALTITNAPTDTRGNKSTSGDFDLTNINTRLFASFRF